MQEPIRSNLGFMKAIIILGIGCSIAAFYPSRMSLLLFALAALIAGVTRSVSKKDRRLHRLSDALVVITWIQFMWLLFVLFFGMSI